MIDTEMCGKYLETIFEDAPARIIISKPPAGSEFIRIKVSETDKGYLFEKFTQKQAFHENLSPENALERCLGFLSAGWSQLNAWGNSKEFSLSVSKKGKLLFGKRQINTQSENILKENPHNRKKNYIITEDKPFPALVDMGIFTKEGKIAKPMYDKFRQINRFVEIVDDAVKERSGSDGPIKVMDFGCGNPI